MRPRHRIPVLFSLSMVDVLCCALGCVILLWVVDSREANKRKKQAGETGQQLAQATEQLDDTKKDLDKTKTLLAQLQAKFGDASKDLVQSNAKVIGLSAELAAELEKHKELLAQLALKDQGNRKLSQDLLASLKKFADLESELKDRDLFVTKQKSTIKEMEGKLVTAEDVIKLLTGKVDEAGKDAKKMALKLDLSDQQLKDLAGKLEAKDLELGRLLNQTKDAKKLIEDLEKLVAKLQAETLATTTKLDKSQTDLLAMSKNLDKKDLDLDKNKNKLEELLKQVEELVGLKKALELQLALSKMDLTKAKGNLVQIEKEKLDLYKIAAALKEEMANRFAGIELTGKKVVFIVDVSGSMAMLDTQIADEKKWPMVCEVIGKLMRSLPDLTHFQVVTFSDKVDFPLGHKGKWLLFDPKDTPDYVVAKLRQIKPQGGTSMYPAFQDAFFYKTGGLDTIYLISDGLPDPPDEDIPAAIKKLNRPEQTTYFCNQIRQQLKQVWNPPAKGKTPVRINSIGFFFESPEVGAFLWALARENDGNFVGMSRP